MVDAAAILAEYRPVLESYRALGTRVADVLREAAEQRNIAAEISSRPKDPAHLVLKAVRKQREGSDKYVRDPVGAMPDKAGVRVIVPFLDDVDAVCDMAREVLDPIDIENMRDRLQPHELGYLGVHIQARLRDEALGADLRHLAGLECEIQVHTKAQNAWSEVSHPLLYKPAGEPSRSVRERILRLVALVAIFDDEIVAARKEVMADPMYRPAAMLDALSKAAVEWRRGDPDPELSLEVLDVVRAAYDEDELDSFVEIIDRFVAARRQAIDVTYANYGPHELDLLDLPAAIAIFERLSSRRELLRARWLDSDLPLEMLEALAEAFGTTV